VVSPEEGLAVLAPLRDAHLGVDQARTVDALRAQLSAPASGDAPDSSADTSKPAGT
jgi:hypothetical protein